MVKALAGKAAGRSKLTVVAGGSPCAWNFSKTVQITPKSFRPNLPDGSFFPVAGQQELMGIVTAWGHGS